MTKKQLIRLTEDDLHNIIKESVNKILNEGKYVNNKPFFPKGENGEFYGPREFIDPQDEMNYSPEMLKSAFKHFERADLAHIGLGPHNEEEENEYRQMDKEFKLELLKKLKSLGLTWDDFTYLNDREIEKIHFEFDKIQKSPKLQQRILNNVKKRKGIN